MFKIIFPFELKYKTSYDVLITSGDIKMLSGTLLKTEDLLQFPYGSQWMPAEELVAADLTRNDTFGRAAPLGVLNGDTQTRPDLHPLLSNLRLANPTDADYFSFRTLAAGGDNDVILLNFAMSNPNARAVLLDGNGTPVALMTMASANTGRIALRGLPAGLYVLSVQTGESLGLNYGLRVQAPVVTGPALVAELTTTHGGLVLPGQTIALTLRITNHGLAAAPASQAALQWSADAQFEAGDAILAGPWNVPALAAGQTWEQTLSVTLPVRLVGPVYLGLTADRRGQVPEAIREDNLAVIRFEAALAPDAFETNDSPGQAAHLGGLVASREWSGLTLHHLGDQDWYRFQLAQTGTTADIVSVAPQDTLQRLHVALYDPTGALVRQAASSADGSVRLSLQGLAAGDYLLRVLPGAAGITYTLKLESAERTQPNLALEGVAVPAELRVGNGLDHATVRVSNYGAEPARSFGVAVVLVDGGTERELARAGVDILAAGQTLELNLPLRVDGSWNLGSNLQLRVVVDDAAVVAELNESDNARTLAIAVARNQDSQEAQETGAEGWMDLGVMRGTQATTGRNLHSAMDVDMMRFRMLATGTAADAITLAFNASTSGMTAVLLDSNLKFVALASEVTPGTLRLSLEGRPAGAYYLVVNGASAPLPYTVQWQTPNPSGANVAWESLDINRYYVTGNVTVTGRLANFGDAATGPFKIRYYASADAVIDPNNDTPLTGLLSVDGLAAGQYWTDTRELDLSALPPGKYYIGLYLDPVGVLTETSRADNIAVIAVERVAAAGNP
jgi:hypothetical protein